MFREVLTVWLRGLSGEEFSEVLECVSTEEFSKVRRGELGFVSEEVVKYLDVLPAEMREVFGGRLREVLVVWFGLVWRGRRDVFRQMFGDGYGAVWRKGFGKREEFIDVWRGMLKLVDTKAFVLDEELSEEFTRKLIE